MLIAADFTLAVAVQNIVWDFRKLQSVRLPIVTIYAGRDGGHEAQGALAWRLSHRAPYARRCD
jgi:hypothetical protein